MKGDISGSLPPPAIAPSPAKTGESGHVPDASSLPLAADIGPSKAERADPDDALRLAIADAISREDFDRAEALIAVLRGPRKVPTAPVVDLASRRK